MNKEKIKLTMIGIIMLPLIGFFYDAYNGFHVLRNSRSLYGIYASLVVTAILAFAGEYISEVINRKDKVSDPLCKRFFHLFEPSDPLGDWIVDINVHDKIREVSIPLRLKFSLAPADSTIEPTTMSEKDLNYFMLYYYLHPAPEKVPQAVQAMHKMGYLEKESAGAPITSFLALIFRSTPSAIETTLADFPGYSPSEQQVLLHALWMADTAQSKMALEKLPLGNDNADLKTSPPKIEELPVESPDVLDMLWGAFMATGDEKYVLPIISVLPYSTIKENIPQFLVGGSAKWSLTSNAVQHKRVFDICSSQLEKQPEDVKEILSEVIAEAANKRAETGG